MEAVAEGLWGLADYEEKKGEIGKAVKCLEAICQSQVSFLPIIEIKTRLRIATLLLNHSNNVNHAKSHLERSQLLLKSIPSCFELKCRAYSLLSQCYQLVGAIPSQKQILNKGLELISTSEDGFSGRLWYCNFNSQLGNALSIEGDHHGSISALDNGLMCATQMCYPELQMFFATSILHVHLMQWENESSVRDALNRCNVIWESIELEKRHQCLGLLFYNELLHVFYLLRICDYKNAGQHVDKLDAAMKSDLQRRQQINELSKELDAVNESLSRSDLNYRDRSALSAKQAHLEGQLSNLTGNDKEFSEPIYFGSARRTWEDKLELAPPPVDGEWLPKGAIYALIDLTVTVFNRPKGLFKECLKRIQSGLQTVQGWFYEIGITLTLLTLNCWINIGNSTIKEERWRSVPACIWWTVWKERNQRCFEGKKNNVQNFKMNCIALYYFWCKLKVLVQAEELFDVLDYLRNFIWQVYKEKKCYHLVNQKTLTNRRVGGGLGIRNLRQQNKSTNEMARDVYHWRTKHYGGW
ncbi:hypothetical protein H5410_046396 [Solanum commersonii]|uniref:Uncharacterized protein n=1 Tax=Solanum commersonii TaxID=4109 RepID=A0A9J5XE42_SOLCO|nr:hypothetical protein H5410_046396 [Solanum commersonii]